MEKSTLNELTANLWGSSSYLTPLTLVTMVGPNSKRWASNPGPPNSVKCQTKKGVCLLSTWFMTLWHVYFWCPLKTSSPIISLKCSFPIKKNDHLKYVGCYSSYLIFSNFYRLTLHNLLCVPLANQQTKQQINLDEKSDPPDLIKLIGNTCSTIPPLKTSQLRSLSRLE
jgi:hypothetical protein